MGKESITAERFEVSGPGDYQFAINLRTGSIYMVKPQR